MKFSEAWLRTWVNPPWTREELVQKLVMLGMEVASVEPLVGDGDAAIDLEITPNRGDCLSIAGLAREVAAASKAKITSVPIPKTPCKSFSAFLVNNDAKEDCSRYCCRVIENVNPTSKGPLWLQERLKHSGVKSISPIVDITNYVMLELGQPLHAFDKACLKNQLVIRRAFPTEKLVTLEEKEITLESDALVIADSEGPVALAGVMGGMNSRVTENTRSIVLESACFNPVRINRVVQKWGIHTESSHRFERGVSSHLQREALERATQLILEICGGEAGPIVEAEGVCKKAEDFFISFRVARAQEILGVDIPSARCKDILKRLGCKVTPSRDKAWQVHVPPYRLDLTSEIDLIEEVARLYGYNEITPRLPPFLPPQREPQLVSSFYSIRKLFESRGYSEVVTYSFGDPTVLQLLETRVQPLLLTNPISVEMSAMRTTLWAGLISVLQNNQNRQSERNRFFELGRRFIPVDAHKTKEEWCLAGVASGSALPEQWGSPKRPVDFFDIKADLEALFALTPRKSTFQFFPGSHSALHPGQTASVLYDNESIGFLGALHPAHQKKLDLKERVVLFEIKLEWLCKKAERFFSPLSKFPAVRRDIALIVEANVQAEDIIKSCEKHLGGRLTDCILFDVYEGGTIPKGKKSMALGLWIGDSSHTLTDEEVSEIMNALVLSIREEHHAILRDQSWQ